MEKQPTSPIEEGFEQEEWEDISGALDTIFTKGYHDSDLVRDVFVQLLEDTKDNTTKASKVVLKIQSFEPTTLEIFDLSISTVTTANLEEVFRKIFYRLFNEDLF